MIVELPIVDSSLVGNRLGFVNKTVFDDTADLLTYVRVDSGTFGEVRERE